MRPLWHVISRVDRSSTGWGHSRTHGPRRARQKWLPANGQALLEELKLHAGHSVATDAAKGWAPIQAAQARAGVRVTDIVTGIREKRIALRQAEPEAGYRGFQVAVADVFAYGEQLQGREQLSGELSLAEFGRSISIREMDRLMALDDAGDLPVRSVIHPLRGVHSCGWTSRLWVHSVVAF